jgi:hypothetical protein
MEASSIVEIDKQTTETGNGKKRERPSEEENVKTDEPLTKKPKVVEKLGAPTCDLCNPTHDPFLSMVLGGSLDDMKKLIPHETDKKYGEPGERIHNATAMAASNNSAMKLAMLLSLNESPLIKPDYHEMIQLACQSGAYQSLAIILGDEHIYSDKYMTDIRWGGLFSDLFSDILPKNPRKCKGQLICLELLAEKSACRKMLGSCMKGLKFSIMKPIFDPNGGLLSEVPIGDQFDLYKILEPWL